MTNHSRLHKTTTNFRLTPKGLFVLRFVLAVGGLAALLMFAAALLAQRPITTAVAANDRGPGVYQQVVVQPGETLWEISSRLAGSKDRAEVLEQIRRYNSLEDSDLHVGQRLYVPLNEDPSR